MINPVKQSIQQLHQHRLRNALRHWLRAAEFPHYEPRGRVFVFNTVRTSANNFHVLADFLLAHLLAARGATTYILMDDGVLKHWDTVQHRRFHGAGLSPFDSFVQGSLEKSRVAALFSVFRIPGCHLRWYSEIVPRQVREELSEENEAFARASTVKFFEDGSVDIDAPEHKSYYDLSLENAIVSKSVGQQVLDVLKPDVYVTSHGIYSTWGPAYARVKAAPVETRVYSRHPYRLGGILIREEAGTPFNRAKLETYLDEVDLGDRERAVAQEYVDARFEHRATDTQEYFVNVSRSKSNATPACERRRDPDTITFGLFPNVVWDAVGKHNEAIYGSVIDWIVDTARTIGESRRHRLIIRFHPSESTRLRGTLSAEQIIAERYPEISGYSNVSIVKSSDPVDTYELMRKRVDVALIYTTTLGSEAQLLGVPVIAVGSGRFSIRTVHRVFSTDAYREALKNPEPILTEFEAKKDRVIRDSLAYHYWLNEEQFFPVGAFGVRNISRIASVDELRSGTLLDQTSMAKTLAAIDVA